MAVNRRELEVIADVAPHPVSDEARTVTSIIIRDGATVEDLVLGQVSPCRRRGNFQRSDAA